MSHRTVLGLTYERRQAFYVKTLAIGGRSSSCHRRAASRRVASRPGGEVDRWTQVGYPDRGRSRTLSIPKGCRTPTSPHHPTSSRSQTGEEGI